MTAYHFGEFLKRTGFPVDIHLHFEVRLDSPEICPLHGKLESTARLEDLETFRGLSNLGLDVEQALAHLHIGIIRVRREEIGLCRHLPGLPQNGPGILHFLLDDVDDPVPEYAELSPRDDICSFCGGDRSVLHKDVAHGISPYSAGSLQASNRERTVASYRQRVNGFLMRFAL
jgi:hypothetical protein